MKKAVIYARYSSDSQTEQSIEGQLRVCQQYAKTNEILIVDTYIDRAMTGKNDARPAFQKMMKDSNKKQWDYVLVYKLDRFSRNKYETTIHKHTLQNNGIKVLSAMESIPDTPEGIILESLLEGMNQYYSEELSQKVHRGLNESYLKGNYTGGPVSYGYDIVDKKCLINEEEAKIIREIFSKFANGITGVDIAENLKSRGVRNKKGKYIDEKQLYKIIANTKYVGKIKHGDIVYTNIYPAIVDETTWQKVQSIRNENKHAPGRKKDKLNFLLSGKLICGTCKTAMVGESGTGKLGKKYTYYNCLGRRRQKKKCNFKARSQKELEDIVIDATWQLLKKEDNIKSLAKDILKVHEDKNKNNLTIKSLENARATALKSTKNLISAIEQGIITEQTKLRLKELESEVAQLDFDIEQEKQKTYSYLTLDKIEKYLKGVVCGDIEDEDTRKLIVKSFIREIIMYNDKMIIVYNFTDFSLTKKQFPDDVEEVIMQSKSKTALKNYEGSYIKENFPPILENE